LREVGLAKAAAYFLLHGLCQLLLRHRTAQATQGAFHGAERTEFVAESHRRTHVLQSANTLLLFAILCQELYLICFQCFTEIDGVSMRAPIVAQQAASLQAMEHNGAHYLLKLERDGASSNGSVGFA
jgi:hypothetical protein